MVANQSMACVLNAAIFTAGLAKDAWKFLVFEAFGFPADTGTPLEDLPRPKDLRRSSSTQKSPRQEGPLVAKVDIPFCWPPCRCTNPPIGVQTLEDNALVWQKF